MSKTLFAAVAAVALAAPAYAQQDPYYEEPYYEGEADVSHALPAPGEIEAMAPVLDRSLDTFLDLDVGPILDAADPWRRRPGYGVPGRTLGALGRRGDPYFEERLRSSIYGITANMGRMMQAFAAAAPALRRSLDELRQAMDVAVDDYHRRSGDPADDGYYPYPDD